jgi:hypothetical protein
LSQKFLTGLAKIFFEFALLLEPDSLFALMLAT